MTLVDEADVLADAHHRVHIVGVDDGSHVVILGDSREKFVDDKRSLRVETRVRLIAEEILRVHHDGTGYRHTLLHTSRNLAREFLLCLYQVYTVETLLCALHAFLIIKVGKHIEWKHHVLQYIERVEKGGALENHSHLTAHHHLFILVHVNKVTTIVEHLTAGRLQESDEILHQNRLSRTALTDDQIGLAGFELHADIIEYGLIAEFFRKIFNFYHSSLL